MLLLVTLLLTVCGLIQGQSRFVNTKYGLVEGHTVPTHNGQSVLSFLGVPFARPPVDDLRWAVSTRASNSDVKKLAVCKRGFNGLWLF